MNSIITPQKNAFNRGRQIQDNLIIVQEAFNALKKRCRIGRDHLSVKLDMNKAFDQVEWKFRYKINGVCGEKIKPQRGLLQGDPLSRYIFLLVLDVFSHMIIRSKE